jgi:hypothetical protein
VPPVADRRANTGHTKLLFPIGGESDPDQQGHTRRRRKRSWSRPQLVNSLPMWPVEGRVPARQHLGRHGRVPAHMRLGPRCGTRQRISAPDADGWREVLLQGSSCGVDGACPAHTASANQRPYPLSGGPTRKVLQLFLHRAQGGNLQAASTLPPMQGVPTPRTGL